MSHVAIVDIEIQDLDALERACESLGLKLMRGQKTYRWFGRHVGDYPLPAGFTASDLGKCEHAITIPGSKNCYEIGVCTSPETGKKILLWDFWAGGYGMQEVAGNNCETLIHEYAKEAVKPKISKLAKDQGWTISEDYDEATGETTIRLRMY